LFPLGYGNTHESRGETVALLSIFELF